MDKAKLVKGKQPKAKGMDDLVFPALCPELKCSDFAESRRFYAGILGFRVDYEREEDGFAMLEREGAWLMIDSLVECSRFIKFEMEKPYGRGINLQIRVSDVDALYDAVKKAKWPVYLEMEEIWYRCNDLYVGNRQFLVQDPDGYVLRFYQDMGERRDAGV